MIPQIMSEIWEQKTKQKQIRSIEWMVNVLDEVSRQKTILTWDFFQWDYHDVPRFSWIQKVGRCVFAAFRTWKMQRVVQQSAVTERRRASGTNCNITIFVRETIIICLLQCRNHTNINSADRWLACGFKLQICDSLIVWTSKLQPMLPEMMCIRHSSYSSFSVTPSGNQCTQTSCDRASHSWRRK